MPRKTLKRLLLSSGRLAISGPPIQRVIAKQRWQRDHPSIHEAAFRIFASLGEQRGNYTHDYRNDDSRGKDLRGKGTHPTRTFASAPLWQDSREVEEIEDIFDTKQARRSLEENPMYRYANMEPEQVSALVSKPGSEDLMDKDAVSWYSNLGCSRLGELQPEPKPADVSSLKPLRPQKKQPLSWYSSLQQPDVPLLREGAASSQKDMKSALSAYASLPQEW